MTELGELKLELAHFALVLRGLPLKLRPCAPAVDPEGYCENDEACEQPAELPRLKLADPRAQVLERAEVGHQRHCYRDDQGCQ